jgi:hypothetical protein
MGCCPPGLASQGRLLGGGELGSWHCRPTISSPQELLRNAAVLPWFPQFEGGAYPRRSALLPSVLDLPSASSCPPSPALLQSVPAAEASTRAHLLLLPLQPFPTSSQSNLLQHKSDSISAQTETLLQ